MGRERNMPRGTEHASPSDVRGRGVERREGEEGVGSVLPLTHPEPWTGHSPLQVSLSLKPGFWSDL